MTKSFYGGKYGGDVGMEGIQPHINLGVKLLLIGIKKQTLNIWIITYQLI